MVTNNHNIIFNNEGCLENKIYKMNLTEVEELFSKNKSERREYIMNQYKSYLKKLLKTNYVSKHWIDGSFVTLKEEPNDIDLLTEFNGNVDNDGKHEKIQDLLIMLLF